MTTSEIKGQIQEDMKAAMRNHEKERLATIRLILAALKQREVDERISLNDEQVLSLLDKMIRQRKDSIQQYATAKRQDLVDKENFEITVIQNFMPAQLGDAEIDALVAQAIAAVKPESIRDMSKVMGVLKPQLQGRADMGLVSQKIKSMLAASPE